MNKIKKKMNKIKAKIITKDEKAITLVALIFTIIILLLLAGITMATLGGENGIFTKVKQAQKAQMQSEMEEQLTMGLQELQVAKKGEATLDDVTQDWTNEVISTEYNPELKEDASYNGKLMVMKKNKITGKFMIDQNLNIVSTEYNTNSVEVEYTTISRTNNKVRINIVVTDNINGIKQIDYPEGNPLKVVSGVENKISIDYDVELGVEYKFVVTSGDGNKTEKIIKIDDYFYNVTKTLGDGATIDNNETKTAYNKTYEATVSTEGNYVITSLTVTMGGQLITTSENDIVDINTGKIKIEKVTGDINITVTTKILEIQYTAIAISTSNSSSNTSSLGANTQTRGTTLYINIIATLEGNNCTVVLKTDNSKTVPFPVTSNGKYTFIVSGTYNGKSVSEEKEVEVKQYKNPINYVKYTAGDWTENEIESLKELNLYNLNEKAEYSLELGKDFTFGGFTNKENNDAKIENIITSKDQSVEITDGKWDKSNSDSSAFITKSNYSGWQILEKEEKNGKEYIKKLIHVGCPENFSYAYDYYTGNGASAGAAQRAEYILSSGERQRDYNTFKARNWDMYRDKELDKKGYIKEIHCMTYDEAKSAPENVLINGQPYFLANAILHHALSYCSYKNLCTSYDYQTGTNGCFGIRPVVKMNDGVYIQSGSGTESDPYILGKED